MPKYPNVKITLTGRDGNAFSILGNVLRVARRAGLPESEITLFKREAVSGDYNNLLVTCMKWFNIE